MSSTGRKEEFLSGSFACLGTFLICARALLSAGGALLAFRCGRLFPPASRPRLGSKKLPSFMCVLALRGKGLGRGRGRRGRGHCPPRMALPPKARGAPAPARRGCWWSWGCWWLSSLLPPAFRPPLPLSRAVGGGAGCWWSRGLISARALLSAGGALLAFRCGRLFPPVSRPRLGLPSLSKSRSLFLKVGGDVGS